jgi:hypothetical protein
MEAGFELHSKVGRQSKLLGAVQVWLPFYFGAIYLRIMAGDFYLSNGIAYGN